MRYLEFSLHDPPEEMKSGAALTDQNMQRSLPFAAIFADDKLEEICRSYGYLMLLGQNLEAELRVCLSYLGLALLRKGVAPRFTGDPEAVRFTDLIEMFELQLDTRHVGSRRLVDDLHRARKVRNRLAHGFLDVDVAQDYLMAGGRESALQRLKRAEMIIFPLIMVVNMVGRAYAADVGVTTEYIARVAELRKAEQRQIEADLREIFQDDANNDRNT